MNSLLDKYIKARQRSEKLCAPLKTEDYVVQPVFHASPPKWQLGHTTWFFEIFILKENCKGYKLFDQDYPYMFNSYYETLGERVVRTDRGNMSRPTVEDVYKYRSYVDEHMLKILENLSKDSNLIPFIELGINHEEQHQELLVSDIKYILGHNPLFPVYGSKPIAAEWQHGPGQGFNISLDEGIYEIGFQGDGFCFDNELKSHKQYIYGCRISDSLVTNGEYLEFIRDGGYADFRHWHSEGWEWVKLNKVKAPHYWHQKDGEWFYYTLQGFRPVDLRRPVSHVSFFEAFAFAEWKGCRLPTEFEWEAASSKMQWGDRWEWTNSAYLPYPGYAKASGAAGEYNGKFMVNQMSLRGASIATPPGHSRNTYRNFFHPDERWQFTGIRLAEK